MTALRQKLDRSGIASAIALSRPRLRWQTLRGAELHSLFAAEARVAGSDPRSLKRAVGVCGGLELRTRPGRLVSDGCAWHIRTEL